MTNLTEKLRKYGDKMIVGGVLGMTLSLGTMVPLTDNMSYALEVENCRSQYSETADRDKCYEKSPFANVRNNSFFGTEDSNFRHVSRLGNPELKTIKDGYGNKMITAGTALGTSVLLTLLGLGFKPREDAAEGVI